MPLDEEQKKQLLLVGGAGVAVVAVIFLMKKKGSTQPDIGVPGFAQSGVNTGAGFNFIPNPTIPPIVPPLPAPGPGHPGPPGDPGHPGFECADGYYYNVIVGRCMPTIVPLPDPFDPPHPGPPPRTCAEGFHLDPVTGRCVADVSGPGHPGPRDPEKPPPVNDLVGKFDLMLGGGQGGGTPSAASGTRQSIDRTLMWSERTMYVDGR